MIFDRYVLPVDVAGFAKAFIESGRVALIGMRRLTTNDSDHRKRRFLRTRRERPSRGSATDQYNEFPSPHGFAQAEDQFGYQGNITFWIRNCALRYAKPADLMSALGQKQTSRPFHRMSALPPIADVGTQSWNVHFVPKADISSVLIEVPDRCSGGLSYFCLCTVPNRLLTRMGNNS